MLKVKGTADVIIAKQPPWPDRHRTAGFPGAIHKVCRSGDNSYNQFVHDEIGRHIDVPLASSRVRRDGAPDRSTLAALAANWRMMRDLSGSARCGAGREGGQDMAPAPTRHSAAAGARRLPRFLRGRRHRGRACSDRFCPMRASMCSMASSKARSLRSWRHDLISPVINSTEQAAFWGWQNAGTRAYALQVDTRDEPAGADARTGRCPFPEMAPRSPALVMSHFACADDPDHPLNAQQIRTFQGLTECFPGIEASLANSGGIHLRRGGASIS